MSRFLPWAIAALCSAAIKEASSTQRPASLRRAERWIRKGGAQSNPLARLASANHTTFGAFSDSRPFFARIDHPRSVQLIFILFRHTVT